MSRPFSPVAIEARRLCHVYPGGYQALSDVDLAIRQGELVGLIGRNGSGKTTLAKHFNGLLKPTSGEVLVQGVSTRDRKISELAPLVGYVFQNPDHQIFLSTVAEEVSYGPLNMGMAEAERLEITNSVLSRLGLWADRHRHPFELSRLKRKLLSIASVMAMKPRAIVFDEPTTGQDVYHTSMVKVVIQDLAAQGCTLVVISHDMSLIAESCRRVIVLGAGSVMADGEPGEVFPQVETLRGAGVDAPEITQIAQGTGISETILTVPQMAEAILKVKAD